MRRVAVTGLGAITPLGLDAPSTWKAAVAGESGIDFIQAFDASEYPGADRGRGEGLRPDHGRAGEGGAPDGPERPARARRRAGGLAGRRSQRGRPGARRRRRRLRDRRPAGDRRADVRAARPRPRPDLAVLHPERARRLGERPDRDLARDPRPELRARLSLRDRLARRRRGSRADPAAATPTRFSPAARSRASIR